MPIKNYSQEPEPHEEPRNKNIFKRGADYVRQWWEDEDRPGILAFHYYYIPIALAGAVALGGEGAWVADEVLGTNFADEMANVQVMPDSGWLTRFGQAYVQCIGLEGGGESPYKCHLDDFLFGSGYPGDRI